MNDKKVILLVEGDPDDELMTLRVLERAGVKNEVVVARDGEEALDYLFVPEDACTQGDISMTSCTVLLEPKLPKVDGLKVLKYLRTEQRTTHLPVAVFVSSEEEEHWLETNEADNNVYIRKPFDFEQFSQAVRHLGLSWAVL